MMLHLLLMIFYFYILTPVIAMAATEPQDFGELSVVSMTQGQLFHLNGRVGEALYQLKKEEQDCQLKVPVVVGSFGGTSVGISQTEGFSLQVTSRKLHDALLSGERIVSSDWHFSYQWREGVDAIINRGILEQETFVLNSKRRWLSWVMEDQRRLRCESLPSI